MAERPTYAALEQRIALLETESAQQKRFENINKALYKISNAANMTSSLDELFQSIHLALSAIFDTTRFFIALYDGTKDSVSFPYCAGPADGCHPPVPNVSRTASLTAEVIRTGCPVLVTEDERFNRIAKTGLKMPAGMPSEIWLGVPLKTRDGIIGVMAVQSCHDPMCYDQTGMDVMVSVAEQVAIAIERKQAEEVLRDTEWKFRALFENSPIGVAFHEMIYDTSGKPIDYRFLEVNETYKELTGVDPRGKTAAQAFPGIEKDPFDWIGTYGHVARTGEQKRFEHYFQHNDCWYDCIAYQYKPDHFVSIFMNNTERKRMEIAYKDSEFKYRSLIEHSTDVVFCVDQNGEYKFVNQVFASTFGKTPDFFLGKTFWDIYPKEHADYRQEASSRVFSTGESQSVEVVVPLPDRTLYYIAKANPVRDETGKVVLNLTHATDITERKQAEAEKAELEAQNRQLQKAESLGRMAGAIAHNFNNRLQVVMGNLEMAMDELPQDMATFNYLNEAMKAAKKSAEVSSQMLTYLGQATGKKELLDLSAICRQNVALLQAAAPNGVILKADLPFSGPLINANMGQILQVLTNLVTNAWEAADKKPGVISLIVKTASQSQIPDAKRFPIDWQPQQISYACMEVADEGHGISGSDIEKLFDPFFTTKFTGRGLGLPVVIGIVQAHAGGITVESETGRGSTFRVFLPVSTEEISLQQEKTVPAPKFEGGGTVLLIEDEEQVRNMAEIMLTHLGFTVLKAKDGVEAVAVFKQHSQEIRWVLSDLTMPRMDGWKTLAALRKLSPGIPVILSSGYDEVQVMADEHPELPNAFLGKPYQLKGLSDAINRILSQNVLL